MSVLVKYPDIILNLLYHNDKVYYIVYSATLKIKEIADGSHNTLFLLSVPVYSPDSIFGKEICDSWQGVALSSVNQEAYFKGK